MQSISTNGGVGHSVICQAGVRENYYNAGRGGRWL